MTQLVIDAEKLADKVILTSEEYQRLLKRQSPSGLNKQYEALTSSHAKLHADYSRMVTHCNETSEALHKELEKEQCEVVRLKRILNEHGIEHNPHKLVSVAELV